MVSLKDIAQRCGVSTATVSKALHDQKDIGAETKNRIKKIAKEMGYLPNAAARVLKTNESNNIGVLYFDEAAERPDFIWQKCCQNLVLPSKSFKKARIAVAIFPLT